MARPKMVTTQMMLVVSFCFSVGHRTTPTPARLRRMLRKSLCDRDGSSAAVDIDIHRRIVSAVGHQLDRDGTAEAHGSAFTHSFHAPSLTPSKYSLMAECMPAPVFCIMMQFTAGIIMGGRGRHQKAR